MSATEERGRYRVTASGSALHMPTCGSVEKARTNGHRVIALSLAEARVWLNAGDRRFCCSVCLPADPRVVRLVA